MSACLKNIPRTEQNRTAHVTSNQEKIICDNILKSVKTLS